MKIYITNNPMVNTQSALLNYQTEYHETDYISILKIVRDKVHLGHKLLTHPLSGSVKPGQTPYKTVVISSEKSKLDEESLRIIEDSIIMAVKLIKEKPIISWHESVLADFQLIDYDLVIS